LEKGAKRPSLLTMLRRRKSSTQGPNKVEQPKVDPDDSGEDDADFDVKKAFAKHQGT